ncbi:polysaccharide pyruvyl transferase family protein [Halolamina sp.]|jgi:hypothetical protein|uniref:polysaccharide pyruvyl transferase family protein n=1 Tax=Halolamina sp. TaxID=1940283 RepID=UPI000223BD64|nr:hypothetical protein Halar_2550 [halophilic archaeon DL31]
MSETQVYFVNDTTTSSNWGCRGTTRALRGLVESTDATIAETAYLDDLHRNDRLLTRVPGVTDWMARVPGELTGARERSLKAIRFATGLDRREAWKRYESLTSRWDPVPLTVDEYAAAADRVVEGELMTDHRDAIRACDAVVINGEGSIYDRRRKGRVLLFLAYLAVERLDTPCVLVNHTADVSDPVVREAAETVYPLLDDVVFREPRSAAACAPFLPGDADDYLGADAAFLYRPIDDADAWTRVVGREGYHSVWPDSAAGFDPTEPYVCVGGSSIYNRPDRPQYDPVPAFESLVRRIEREVAPVVLTASCGTDARIMRPVAERSDRPLIGPRTPVTQAIDVLGNAAAYVGGRWHPSVYAATGGTPVVTLTANTYKTAGIVEHLELDAPTFDALSLHEEVNSIVDLVSEYVDRGDELRGRLDSRVEELTSLAARNVQHLPGSEEPAEPSATFTYGNLSS